MKKIEEIAAEALLTAALLGAPLFADGGGVQGTVSKGGATGALTNYTASSQKVGLRLWNDKALPASKPYPFNNQDYPDVSGQAPGGLYYQDLWPVTFSSPLAAGDKYSYDGPWGYEFSASGRAETLIKTGTCNAAGARTDADPISLSELAALLQNPAYYDESYRYAGGDRLGSHGGAYSGGIFDTFFGETQFQFAIPGRPEETGNGAVGVSGKWMNNCGASYCASASTDHVAFDVNRGGQGALFWMALVANQEYFGIDLQMMIGIGMKESNLLTDNNNYTAAQDIGNLTSFAIDQGYGTMHDLVPTLPTLFQFGIDGGSYSRPDGLPYWRYTGDAAGGQGLSQAQWQDMISNDGSMSINAVLSSAAFWHMTNNILSSCSNLGYKQLLENSSSGYSDPAAGFCLASLLYNKGVGTTAVYTEITPTEKGGKLNSLLNNQNACETINSDIAGNIGGYAGPVVDNARRLISASVRAETDPSVEILDRWITLDQLKRFWFGQVSLTDPTPCTPATSPRSQYGGLLMHFNMSTEERQAIWDDVEAAFNLQAQKWGGGKISLRYDWISNLRVAKSKIPTTVEVSLVDWMANFIKQYSNDPVDGSGQHVDNTFPFILDAAPAEASDPEGFGIEVHAAELHADRNANGWDRGIADVEWTVDTLWRSWSTAKVSKTTGNAFDAIYKVDLGKSDLGAVAVSGGWVWVRAVDSCGNAVASKVKVVAVKYPKIAEAFIEDTDGVGNGDRITVTTSQDDDVSSRLQDAVSFRYSWPTSDGYVDGAAFLADVKNGPGTFAFEDRTLTGGANSGLGGKVEIGLPGTTIKGNIADRVGPVIKYASILESDPAVLYVLMSENVADLANPTGSYLVINGSNRAITNVAKQDQSWAFTLAEPLDPAQVKAGSVKVRLVPGSVSDIPGNPTPDNNQEVVVLLDEGPVPLAEDGNVYLDRDGNGRMDRIQIAFTRPITDSKLATMTVTYTWREAGKQIRCFTDSLPGEKLKIDPQNAMLLYYDVPDDSKLALLTYFDPSQSGWGRLTVFQKSLTPAISDRNDVVEMADGMGPIALYARYGETKRADIRPDTLRVEFSEPIDTSAAALFSDRLYWTKSGSGNPYRIAHQSPAEKKRILGGDKLLVYYQPEHATRPGIGDSLRIVYEADETGLIVDRSGNKASSLNPWTVIDGKLRSQVAALEGLYHPDERDADLVLDTALFFDYTVDLDSVAKTRPGLGFTISFSDSAGDADRSSQRFGYEVAYFTNLGASVWRVAKTFTCTDMEKQAAGSGLLAAVCDVSSYPSSRKIKIWVPWDYRADNGRQAGAGAYVQQFRIWGDRMSGIDDVRTFGVVRSRGLKPSKGGKK